MMFNGRHLSTAIFFEKSLLLILKLIKEAMGLGMRYEDIAWELTRSRCIQFCQNDSLCGDLKLKEGITL